MNLRPLMIIPPIVLGILGFRMMMQTPDTDGTPPETRPLAVRVMQLEPQAMSATAVGYGHVEPVRVWSAISEVQGRVIRLADGLAVGTVVAEGEELAAIDRTDYELGRQKTEANIAAVEAQISELDRQIENSRATLEVEERILAVAQAEFDRVASLVGRGASTQATQDAAQKTLLAQTTAVTNLKNTLELYPAQRKSLEATLAVRKAELAEANRSLEKTTITAPFRGRVSELNVEVGQFARSGDVLMVLDDISAVEITAEIQPSAFVPMVTVALGDEIASDGTVDTSQAVSLMRAAGVTASVSMEIAGLDARWPSEIKRLRGTMDSQTGTLGLVVRVDDPLVSRREVNRPPLNVGSFVTVTLATQPVAGSLTVPRDALRYTDEGKPFVYIVEAGDTLGLAEVTTGQVIGNEVVVFDGLEGTETLVLSDPHPPVLGMALTPVTPAAMVTAAKEQ
ncbi:HlyD family secretion protein [Aliiruegeria haliotis]|uniref:HlyD family secretion protein n=1 Tax=Aliiruegeria haliotis TaxID=1280846 RepID=A0A2T0S075_9RHOB|nr:HlyD family efflux transporter periplasmic adaptor subunit [Aliiruegeria haliotis]PRY26837.1 HlyD family secretion protein [Aliiruegeria haliotis]